MKTSHSGRGIAPFHRCDRCGATCRVTDLKRQLGIIVCHDCYDNPIAHQRPQIIQDKLAFSASEELRVADILTENGNDDLNNL